MFSTSLIDSWYYVTFIDDSSHKTLIYFLKTRDEVLSKLIEFKALVENQTGRKVKALRLDNGGKYTFAKFDSLCREADIKRD
jgi:hypothetical protein